MAAMEDPAWPSPPDLRRILYWGRSAGARPQDHVRKGVPATARRSIVFILRNGKDAHPSIGMMGWASCRICGANLGSRDLTAFGCVWPEKAEHYITEHAVWTPDCTHLLQRAFAHRM